MMKKRLSRFFRLILAFLLVFSWLFSGWPKVWNSPRIPPAVVEVGAINKTNNWSFELPSGASQAPSDWTKTTTTDTAAGTPEVAALTDNTAGNYYVGSQSVRGRWSSSGNGQAWNVTLYQSFTPTSSTKAKLRGYYKREWKSSSAAETSKVFLELASGTAGDGTGGTVAITAFSNSQGGTTGADANFTTAPNSGTWSSETTLTGGVAYTIRIRWEGTGMDSGEYGGAWIDGVELSVAPIGLSASAPAGTTNASLTWTASTPGTGAPGLHATTPYQVYRNTASPVTTSNFLANSNTNSYTDSSATGNTTYYFAIADLDTNGITSPLSSEVNIKTLPGAPGTPTFSNVGPTSIDVNWTPPNGGADNNYKVERAPDVSGSPGSWAEVTSGATSPWTNNTGLSCNTTYWYRVRGTNGTGDGAYSDQASQATGSCGVSISLDTNGSVAFGLLGIGSSADTTPSGKNDVEVIRVDAGPANLEARSTGFTAPGNTWNLGVGNSTDQVKWEFSKDTSSWTTFAVAGNLYSLATSVGTGATTPLYLRLTMPTSTGSYDEHSVAVTVVASSP